MQDPFTIFQVALFPFLFLILVMGTIYPLLSAVNHFFHFWNNGERFLDIYLLTLFSISLISFIAFFFVVRGLEFCA